MIVATGWLVLLVYSYPGQMVAESFEALRQARSPFNAPENPPALSALWRWLELVVAGPFPMFVVQSTAFAYGAYKILSRATVPQRAAWITAGMLVFPPMLVPLSVIGSASLMSGLLVLATAGLLSERRGVHLAGLGLVLLATLAQPHALVASLPLVVMLFRWRHESAGARRFVHALAAWMLVTAVGLAATKHYSKKPTAPLWSYVEPRADREWQPVPPRVFPEQALKLGVPTRTTAIQDATTDALSWLAEHTPLFSPWLFLVMALAAVPLSLAEPTLLALAVSGITTFVAYRNPVWLVASACIAAAAALSARLRR
jgi:hypothetical protein